MLADDTSTETAGSIVAGSVPRLYVTSWATAFADGITDSPPNNETRNTATKTSDSAFFIHQPPCSNYDLSHLVATEVITQYTKKMQYDLVSATITTSCKHAICDRTGDYLSITMVAGLMVTPFPSESPTGQRLSINF